MLQALHDWFDAAYPAPPDSFKIHGEFYMVLSVINVNNCIASALFGLQLGLSFRTIVSAGYWRLRQE